MPKIQHSWRQPDDGELWKQKRGVGRNQPEQKPVETETAESDDQKRAEEAFKEFEGKSIAGAKEQVDKELHVRDEQIQSLVDNWNNRLGRGGFNTMTEKVSLGYWKVGSKKELNDLVHAAAKVRVEGIASSVGLDGSLTEKHTKNSLSLLHAKSEVINELKSEVDRDLSNKREELKRVQDCQKALGFWRKEWRIRNSDLENKADALKRMSDTITDLRNEYSAKGEKGRGAETQVRQMDERIRNVILGKDATVAGELDRAIRETIMDESREDSFENFLEKNQQLRLSEAEKDACRRMIKFLREGRSRPFGRPKATDVQDFYIKKQLERGVLNKTEDKIEERIQRLQQRFPLGQEISLHGLGTFFVVKKPTDKQRGFLIRNAAGTMGFLDISNEKKPFITFKKGKRFERMDLFVEKSTNPSLIAVEFTPKAAVTLRGIDKTVRETTIDKTEVKVGAKTDRLKAVRMKNVSDALSAAVAAIPDGVNKSKSMLDKMFEIASKLKPSVTKKSPEGGTATTEAAA